MKISRTMSQMMEEYESNESEDKRSSIWSKAVSVGKKVLTAGVVVSSAPLLFPPLIVASTIAFISSVPFCLFLANYACTQKVMSSLLPATEERGEIENDESGFQYHKIGVDEYKPWMATTEPTDEDEEMAKESTSLIERIREEGRADRRTINKEVQDGENSENAKSEKVQDQAGEKEATETGRQGELGATTNETFKGKDEETSSNEPVDQAVIAPSGTREEKRKNTTKKKKKTGRAVDLSNGLRGTFAFLQVYSEEQMWEKMEALRKVVGYSVARSDTYAEDLKTLYVFTGVVEPPRSQLMNQDGHAIANVSVRLRFLMSVIGIN
ncbi:unnamed protein product [Microthlaspi erraticum]|uniref:Uncharacterized protein n=1 Tax=Microthlaspi erraticum TaxID=1685480 RepID=A0A6D2JK93_9BRAS|nr:unnamed protein product [Microthlaspi erraticum]